MAGAYRSASEQTSRAAGSQLSGGAAVNKNEKRRMLSRSTETKLQSDVNGRGALKIGRGKRVRRDSLGQIS